MRNFKGESNEIYLANKMIRELKADCKIFIDKCDKKGVDNLKENERARYNQFQAIDGAIDHSTINEASLMMDAIYNYRIGRINANTFIDKLFCK